MASVHYRPRTITDEAMDIIPSARVLRFGQLEPGELFLDLEAGEACYAFKTAPSSNGDSSGMVLVGPTFYQNVAESFISPRQPATVLSFGKDYSILLPTEPTAWSAAGPSRIPVCLAIAGTDAFICANGYSPQNYLSCYVNVKTGAILEKRPPGSIAFTNSWEIALLGATHPPRSILKYPLK